MVNLLKPKTWRRKDHFERQDVHCCAEERNLWRQIARKNGIIPQLSGYIDPTSSSPSDRKASISIRRKSRQHSTIPISPPVKPFNLLGLPLELRERIYYYYFLHHGAQRLTPFRLPPIHTPKLHDLYYYKPIPPHEPALTILSRQIREESLKVFYSTYRFPLIIHAPGSLGHYAPVRWYHNLSPSHLAAIKHWELFFCFEADLCAMGVRQADAFILNVDLDSRTGGFELVVAESFGGMTVATLAERRAITVRTRRVLEEVVKVPGVGRWGVGELEKFVPSARILA
ncbi:hypothetical protein LTR86_007780 [Recurvomyces mirabilis]|nr:hypothetical protein LTR86_007780 [Recurvomyces mirabilis]